MKEKINKVINSKRIIIILIIVLILLIGVTSTYAWFTWSNPDNTNLTLTINNIDVIFNVSPDINVTNLSPVLYPEEGALTTFSLKKNNSSLGDIDYTITLDITTISEELKNTDFKWLLKQEDTILNNGDFSTSSNNSSITLYTGTLTDTNTLSYTLYIYINGNNLNSSDMMNKSLAGTINISGEEKETLATHITSLYTNAEKSEVTNNSITYNYATSVSLMNDRLGSSTTDINGGNIRYYGASPNNYIYFNCSDYSNQTSDTCELWRIIGIFNGKVKLIRNESIGDLAWDQDKNIDSSLTTYDNNWATSSLQVLLNEKYYYGDTIGTITYYSGETGGASTNLDLSNIGIKNDTTRNIISSEVWYLEMKGNDFIFANGFYNSEIGSSRSWNGKVGLLYLSELAYSQNFVDCNIPPENYNYFSDVCPASNNWLINDKTSYLWLITSGNESTNSTALIASGGENLHYTGGDYGTTYLEKKIYPTLYLNSDVIISDTGDGTEDNPYRLSV